LRDILTHAYFQIEDEIIRDIVQTKVQPLQEQVQQLLENEFGDILVEIEDERGISLNT
jgi:uncharacterized protein with HEPN domain